MYISDVFSEFDVVDKKGFDAHTIINALSSIEENKKNKPEFEFENLAFTLVPSKEINNWGTYFGPQAIFKDADDNFIEVPSLQNITIDAVNYWEQRYKTTINPLLTMRYAGLVWDFKSHIFHQKYDSDLYRIYVDSMLKVCNGDYSNHPIVTTNTLERLFHIAKNNERDLILVKKAYIDFEKRHATDDSIRYWASRFIIMLENKKSFSQDEINAIVQEHEQRLSRMCTPVDGRVNPWIIEKQALLLADYYNSLQQRDNIKRVLNCVEQAFLHESNNMDKLQLMGNLENLHAKYRYYLLEEEANRLFVEIQMAGPNIQDEMHVRQIESTISPEDEAQAEQMFGTGVESDEDRFRNFAVYFIPNKVSQQASLEELVKKDSFRYLNTNRLLDAKGRPMSVVGSYENDPEGHLILHITQELHNNSFFLDLAIKTMIECESLTTENIMNRLIKPSPIFEEDRHSTFRKALDLFFANDFITFCHLIIPQIENAICNLVSISGASVLKSQRNNKGFQLKTLDDLLRENPIKDSIGEDGAYYLRLVLSDQRALNIRNLLCHGIVPPEAFDVHAANRLLHVLIILGLIRYERKIVL